MNRQNDLKMTNVDSELSSTAKNKANSDQVMQRSSEQPLVGEERYVTTLITAAKETKSIVNWRIPRTIVSTTDYARTLEQTEY